MKTIAHISDLHFGAIDMTVVDGLLRDLAALAPSLIVISGDLTQRATDEEFMAAKEFLRALPSTYLVIPGNHDVPLYRFWERIFDPFGNYKTYISETLDPLYSDEEIAVLGLNTARRFPIVDGRISLSQIADMKSKFALLGDNIFKVVVTHHPLVPPAGKEQDAGHKGETGRAMLALGVTDESGVDLLLSGHLHFASNHDTSLQYPALKRSAVVVQAGTATSTRRRGEPNAFNFFVIEHHKFSLTVRAWDGTNFQPTSGADFEKDPLTLKWHRIVEPNLPPRAQPDVVSEK
ncbi:MAG: metallophosphoesterase [Rhizobacter sp.]|nr:metallophosphoesterase [Chlorobiales bacterium]